MSFKPRNAYHLRISTEGILPLFLYLDERHIDWMSDLVLQHVLADLRPLIIPKLQAEKNIHGPGNTPGNLNKRGTVEVHRGETYQFAYFFRKTEPHTVLLKSRYFVTVRPSKVVTKSSSGQAGDRDAQKKRLDAQTAKKGKRKRSESRRNHKKSRDRIDEDEWSPEQSENMDADNFVSRKLRPKRKQRRIIVDASPEGDDDDIEDEDFAMDSLPLDEGSNENPNFSIDEEDRDDVPLDANHEPPDVADIELVVEEEEEKPKPLLKLKYQSFTISGHCLCVVVEPWPPLRVEPRGLRTSLQRAAFDQSFPPSKSSATDQRAETPLFLPEYDRAPSEAPLGRGKTLPAVPRLNDKVPAENDVYSDDDLMNFSQTLNTGGQMYAIAADDDDDMDGAVLFGDADEVRELF